MDEDATTGVDNIVTEYATYEDFLDSQITSLDLYYLEVCSSTLLYSNCNYIVFSKLPWPKDNKRTFRSSSQAATCPPVYHTRWRLHTLPFNC